MKSILGAAILSVGLTLAFSGAANAQTYYNGYYSYYYPYGGYYGAYPSYRYYGPRYSWYYGPNYNGSAAYSDPYVYWRPYSDGAGPRVSGHTGY
jgi:hypothetical protein